MNIYRATGARPVLDIEPGTVGELELSEDEEASLLAQGRLQIEPREYEVIGSHAVNGAKPGDKFKGAFRIPHERALLEGGHIERVKSRPEAKAAKPAAANNKEQ